MAFVEKEILLRSLDHLWREHLLTLEHLRQAVGLRGYGQRDPLNEYKTEAFTLFEAMLQRLREVVTGQLMRVEVTGRPEELPSERELPPMEAHHINPFTGFDDAQEAELALAGPLFGPGGALASAAPRGARRASPDPANPATWGKVGRNEACPCGSGKKFKHCHGALV
jgi:preprotein translocase subunit SecA